MKISAFAPLIGSLALAFSGCSSESDPSPATGGTGGVAAGGAGAGGTATTGGAAGTAGTAAACDAPNLVFMVDGTLGGCNGAACHIPELAATFPPDLISPGVEARVLNVNASAFLSCSGEKYIDSANVENSLMLKKLVAVPDACGEQMPFALAALPQDKIDCIRSWITSVAATAQ